MQGASLIGSLNSAAVLQQPSEERFKLFCAERAIALGDPFLFSLPEPRLNRFGKPENPCSIPERMSRQYAIPSAFSFPVSFLATEERISTVERGKTLSELYSADWSGTRWRLELSKMFDSSLSTQTEVAKNLAELTAVDPMGSQFLSSPIRYWKTDQTLCGHMLASGFLHPFGGDNFSINLVTRVQNALDQKVLGAFCLETAGSIAPSFLKFIRGNYDEQFGPVPDLLVLARIPLASGGSYRMVYKPSRAKPTKDLSNDREHVPADEERIDGIERYFSFPENRVSSEFFGTESEPTVKRSKNFTIEQHLAAQEERDAKVEAISSKQTKSIFSRGQPSDWPEALLLGEREFSQLFRAAIDGCPKTGIFSLNEFEKQQIFDEYLPLLLQLCLEQLDECNRDLLEGRGRELALGGYVGPSQGYFAKMQVYALDVIVDFRRRQREAARPTRNGFQPDVLPASSVYGPSDLVFELNDLAQILQKVQFSPHISVSIYDPLANNREGATATIENPKMDLMYREFVEENYRRVNSFATPGYLASIRNGIVPPLQEPIAGVALQEPHLEHFENVLRVKEQIDELSRYRRILDELFKGSISHTGRQAVKAGLRDTNRPVKKMRVEVEAVKREAELELLVAKERYVEAFGAVQPDLIRALCQRVHSISDDETAKFIYGTGRDRKTRITYESKTKKRISHLRLLGGKVALAAGQMFITKGQMRCASFSEWKEYNEARLKREAQSLPPRYECTMLDNGSGHFQCHRETLPFAAREIFPTLERLGISTTKAVLFDALGKGMRVRNWSMLIQQIAGEAGLRL